ncbi:MAG: YbaK/EbsC family protein [Phycisphaerae bacterium]|nr:YbaK/EbsC family protein [Phycisphaerae bacterium]
MKIQDYLKQQQARFELHDHPPAYTAQEVAAEEHVSGNQLAKVVVVKADKEFAMCVLAASYKLDMEKVAAALDARKVRLADESELAKLFPDIEVGATPPFGDLYGLSTVVDGHLAEEEEITFQAGSHRQAIRMKYADYAALAKPSVADLGVHL